MQVYTKPRGGQRAYKGHTITLPNDVKQIATILPHLPSELPVLVFRYNDKQGSTSKELTIRKEKVLNALNWLAENNPPYNNIVIDMNRVNQLPDNGYSDELNYCNPKQNASVSDDNEHDDIDPDLGPEQEERVYDENTEMGSFVPAKLNSKSQSNIISDHAMGNEANNKTEWVIGHQPYNEFACDCLASLAFPTLFPDCKGDPTNKAILRPVANSDTECFGEKLKHLIKFAENINGNWVYHFAAHPRFAFWAYNMLYRKRLLLQGKSKQNPVELAYTIDELREMIENNTYNLVMRKLTYYAKNIAGTNSYWHDAKENLKAIINQVGAPTMFWTLSCADFHWPEYHSLLCAVKEANSQIFRNNLVNNPHLIDWLSTVRTENFVKYWLYETLGATWHWYRLEYAVMRGSIHCHGVAKLGNDPDLCELSEKALAGFLAENRLKDSNDPTDRDLLNPIRPRALECRICEELFTLQGDKVPRLLSCGHSVCHECLGKIQRHGILIQCPFDRVPTELGDSGIWGLKKNFALLELLERLQLNKDTSHFSELTNDNATDVIKCDEDDSHVADIYCSVCLTNLCQNCAEETHSTSRTLALHRQVPISEKPKVNPPCSLHPSHVLEFACLEDSCRQNPLMCYICKDYASHKGHKHVLIENEADSVRKSITNAVQHVKTFSGEVNEFKRKLAEQTEKIEGGVVVEASADGDIISRSSTGTADKARLRIHQYFNDLRDTIDQQESEALSIINDYLRERLCYLRQQQEDMAVLVSQISNVCLECDKALRRSDAEVVQARSNIVKLLDTVQQQQQLFIDLAELCKEDTEISFAFTKDNRVHIGPKMEMRVVALGLDNGGKTSILFKLKQNEFVSPITTIGFNVETVEHKNVKFTIWDVGGVQKLRPLWRHYYLNTQAVIFVIDSTNSERFCEAHDELGKLVAEKRLQDALLLIYANKQDLPNAIPTEELCEKIGIHRLCSGRSWILIGCSAHTGNGLQEGLDWMACQLLSEFDS